MIRHDDFKLIATPRALLDLMKDPPLVLIRPALSDLAEVKAWLLAYSESWREAGEQKRREAGERLLWMRWMADERRITDDKR